jgi:hypothetical protein
MSRESRASEPDSGAPARGATSTAILIALVGLWLIGVATGFTIQSFQNPIMLFCPQNAQNGGPLTPGF